MTSKTEFELRNQLTRLTIDLEVLRSELYGQLQNDQRQIVSRMHESTNNVRQLFNHWVLEQNNTSVGNTSADQAAHI